MSPSRYPDRTTGVSPLDPSVTGPRKSAAPLTLSCCPENADRSGRFPVVITVPEAAGIRMSACVCGCVWNRSVVTASAPVVTLATSLKMIAPPRSPCMFSRGPPSSPTVSPSSRYADPPTLRLERAPASRDTASRFPLVTTVPSTAGTVRYAVCSASSTLLGSNSSTNDDSSTRNNSCPGFKFPGVCPPCAAV
eukprot:3311321-Rhodomonas_salina.2